MIEKNAAQILEKNSRNGLAQTSRRGCNATVSRFTPETRREHLGAFCEFMSLCASVEYSAKRAAA
jgi:hypothetical protein